MKVILLFLMAMVLFQAQRVSAQIIEFESEPGVWSDLDSATLETRVLSIVEGNFRITNNTGVTLTNVRINQTDTPTVFEVRPATTIAAAIQNGQTADFRLRFAPQQAIDRLVPFKMEATGLGEPRFFAVQAIATGEPVMSIYGYREFSESGTSTPISDTNGSTQLHTSVTDFGIVNVASGAVRNYYYEIINGGNVPLMIFGISSTDPQFNVNGISASLANPLVIPAYSRSPRFTIRFDPQSEGMHEAEFRFTNNLEPDDEYTINVRGQGSNSLADIDVYLIDGNLSGFVADTSSIYTTAPVNTPTQKTLRIRNSGSLPLTITSAQIGSTAFLAPGTTVAPGTDVDGTVTVNRATAGEQNYVVTIISNDPDAESTYTFTLRVFFSDPSAPPKVDVRGAPLGGTIVKTSNTYVIASGSTAAQAVKDNGTKFGSRNPFGDVRVLNDRESHTFWIYNESAQNLTIGAPVLAGVNPGDFVVTNFPSASTLAPLEIRYFQIAFDPIAPGNREATLSFTTNDPLAGNFSFTLAGVAVNNAINDIQIIQYQTDDTTVKRAVTNGLLISDAASPTEVKATALTNMFRIANVATYLPVPLILTGPVTCSAPACSIQYLVGPTPSAYPFPVDGPNTNTAALFFKVLFDPTPSTPDPLNVTVSIPTNDPDTPVFSFQLLLRSFDETALPRITRVEVSDVSFQGGIRNRIRLFGLGDPRYNYRVETSRNMADWTFTPTQASGTYSSSNNSRLGSLDETELGGFIQDKTISPSAFFRLRRLSP